MLRSPSRLLLVTTDPVLLSFVRAILIDAGIDGQFADQFTSAIEGSLPIFPRRVLVAADAWHRAKRALVDAGLGPEIEPDPDDAGDIPLRDGGRE